jgi:uncharacterized membrane protein
VETGSDTTYGPLRRALGEAGVWIGCHQAPERSFFFRGTQFPVCARCTGVILAQTGTALAALAGRSASPAAGAVLMAPMGIDWALQYTGIRESTNARRFITGALAGAGYVTLVVNTVHLVRTRRGRAALGCKN